MRTAITLLALLLTGCCTPTTVPGPARIIKDCAWIQDIPLSFRKEDTPDTKREIITISDAVTANCPKR